MMMPTAITDIGMVIFLYMTSIFILALIRRDNSIVDVFWGLGFVVIAVYSLLQSGDPVDLRKMIVTLLVILWGVRLSVHIYLRNRGMGEDFRYRQWRESWKFFIVRSFFQIFMLQGLFMLIISTPIWLINYASMAPLGFTDTLGLVLFGTGFFFEAVGDLQLATFRKDPANKGKILNTGLWELTRHPNYFGEALVWWGLGCYALAIPDGWYAMIGPLAITLLLRYVSGVPMLEKRYEGRADWEAYKKKTAPFVPFIHRF